MQFVEGSATMSVVLFVFGVGLVSLVKGDRCGMQEHVESTRCDALFGYNDEATRTSRGDAFNFTQLIAYCRNPNRQDFVQCKYSAFGGCDIGVFESERAFFQELIQLAGNALGYLCSEVDLLDRDRICLIRTTRDVTQCMRSSTDLYKEEYTNTQRENGHLTQDSWKTLVARQGRRSMECVYELLNEQCNSELGNVFGNFLYGVFVLIFDEENKGRR